MSNPRVRIITHSRSGNPDDMRYLAQSADRLGLHLTVLTGPPLPRASNDVSLFMEGSRVGLDCMRSLSEEYVICTDAFDVLVVRWNEDELISNINSSMGSLLVSCEANCFPDGPWREVYDKSWCETPWRYANTGQFCGRTKSVIRFTETLRSRIGEVVNSGAAQEVCHRLFCESYPMSLDYHCGVFQSMFTDYSKNVILTDEKVVVNELTETEPMFLHFNGRAQGIAEWWSRLS